MKRAMGGRQPLGILVLAVVLVAACFSERSVNTGPQLGETCDVTLPTELLGSTIVAIRNFSFQPAEVRIASGGTVTWVNCAPADEPAHSSTSDGGVWGSELLVPGSFYSFTFSQPGSFPYHCEPHPFMQGSVAVE